MFCDQCNSLRVKDREMMCAAVFLPGSFHHFALTNGSVYSSFSLPTLLSHPVITTSLIFPLHQSLAQSSSCPVVDLLCTFLCLRVFFSFFLKTFYIFKNVFSLDNYNLFSFLVLLFIGISLLPNFQPVLTCVY